MSFFDKLLGNAIEIDVAEATKTYGNLLVSGEEFEAAFTLIRDVFFFTNKRIIVIDKQGLSGKKMEFLTLPYSKITKYSCETTGTFDIDSDVKVWIGSDPVPMEWKLSSKINIHKFYLTLSKNILG